jgi:hypothetical protein
MEHKCQASGTPLPPPEIQTEPAHFPGGKTSAGKIRRQCQFVLVSLRLGGLRFDEALPKQAAFWLHFHWL